MRRCRIFLAAALFLLLSGSAYAFNLGVKGSFDDPPPARMICPVREEASLQGKAALEFQWSDPIPTDTESFYFRLYKGYETSEPNMIVKEKLDRDADSISVAADKFENGGVYTWTLVRIANSGRKSESASSSFKVIK